MAAEKLPNDINKYAGAASPEEKTMVQKIEKDGVLYAIVHRQEDWKEGLDFFTPDEMFLQVGTFWYQEGNPCKAHRHIRNERPNNLTQECNIVLAGSMRANIYDKNNQRFHQVILKSGDLIVTVNGGHGYEILEPDTRVVECKNGPFVSVEKDKRPI